MKGYIVIGLIFELVLSIMAGNLVAAGSYGNAVTLALLVIIFAIYSAAYIVVYMRRKR